MIGTNLANSSDTLKFLSSGVDPRPGGYVMRPTNRLFLFALISFFLFGTVPVVHAAAHDVTCDESPQSGLIDLVNTEDTYNISLVVGQKLIIDVDAEKTGSTLDSYLVVSDSNGDTVDVSDKSTDVAPDAPTKESEDPYLEISALVDDTYTLTISAAGDGTSAADEGPYTLLFECFDPGQPTSPEFKWPVEVGDLIGSTGSDAGSLINIAPDNAESSLPFDLSVGRIADIEFDPSTNKLFVAINESPGSIITLDPATGDQDQTFNLVPVTETVPTVVALEAVENTLYGVQVDSSSGEEVGWVLVTMDITPGTATLNEVVSLASPVRSLAYHQSDQILYGASGTALLKIDLALSPVDIQEVVELTGLSFEIASMDFSHEDVLYVVDIEGNLFKIDLTTAHAEFMGVIDVSDEVSGLTFVVGAPPGVDPIKTICSSTLTSSASASSATAAPKLSRFKRKKNPLHRAIGLFKFKGKAGETVTLNAKAEDEESVEAAVEESSVSERKSRWLNYWRGKGRVFLGIRDSIPDLDFRVRKKDQLPLSMSATLPADGTYYVMLIRPLLRFYKTDYCITLESDMPDSQAWESFDVAWPSDDSDDDTASTSAAEPENVQKSTETVASASANDSPVPVALSTTAVNEPDGGDPEVGQTLAETPVVELVAKTPVVTTEPVAETPVVEPVAEIPVVTTEPVAEIPVVTTEPVAEIPVVTTEPVAAIPVVEPVAETPVVEPVVEIPVVEPVAAIPVVEPVAAIPVVEPVAEIPVVKPVAEIPVVEPVAAIPVVTEPVVLTPVGAEPDDEGGR